MSDPVTATTVPEATVDAVREQLLADGGELSLSAIVTALKSRPEAMRGAADLVGAARQIHRELAGAGPLEPLLLRPGATDIAVNGPGEVLVDTGAGLAPSGVHIPDAAAARTLAQRLAARAGRRLDDACPFVDGVFGARDGLRWRLHALLDPIAVDGTCLSLRVLRAARTTFADLVASGSIPPPAEKLLRAIVAARLSYLVVGGTGSGKTTLLGALLGLVPGRERLVCVEDAPELAPDHPHVVRLAARHGNTEGAGEVGLRELVRQSLRMRPDRLVVGEVRGAEVVDLLAALNTGHDGSAGTIHANSAAEVPARLAALGALGGLPAGALAAQVAASLRVVIGVRREPDGRRHVAEIGVVTARRDAAGPEIGVELAWSCAGPGSALPVLAELLTVRGADPGIDAGSDTGADMDGAPTW